MSTLRIPTGSTEPLQVLAVDALGTGLTGLADLFFRIRRVSDGFWFDFSDSTFKTEGSVVTLESASLTQVSVTAAPGLYELAGGFNFGSIANPTPNETYSILPIQTPGTTARIPGPGEIKEGDFVDNIDFKSSDLANKDVSKTYNPASDSLEAIRDRIG